MRHCWRRAAVHRGVRAPCWLLIATSFHLWASLGGLAATSISLSAPPDKCEREAPVLCSTRARSGHRPVVGVCLSPLVQPFPADAADHTASQAAVRGPGMDGQKRKAEEGEDAAAAAAKKQKVETNGSSAAGSGAAAAGAAPKKLGIDLEKLQKAKLALQKQKELAEKLKKAGITVRRPQDSRWWREQGRRRRRQSPAAAVELALQHLLTPPHRSSACAAWQQSWGRWRSGSRRAASSSRGAATPRSSAAAAGCAACGAAQACHQAAAAAAFRRPGAASGCHR